MIPTENASITVCGRESSIRINHRIIFVGISLNVFFWILFLGSVIEHRGVFDALAVDFGYFWAAGNAFVTNGAASVYDLKVLAHHAELLLPYYSNQIEDLRIGPVLYPPAFIVLLIPFSLISSSILGFATWTLFNVILAVWVSIRLADRIETNRTLTSACVLLFFPVAWSLYVGQPTGILLVGLWKGIEALESDRGFHSGIWFGLLLIKPNLIALLAIWFLATRRWRAFGGLAIASVIYLASTIAFLGLNETGSFVLKMTNLGANPGDGLIGTAPDMMVSWRGLVEFLKLSPQSQGMATAFAALAVSISVLSVIVIALRFSGSQLHFQVALVFIVTLVANPHAHIQAVTLIVPTGAVLMTYGTLDVRDLTGRFYVASLVLLPIAGLFSLVLTGWLTWVPVALGVLLITMLGALIISRPFETTSLPGEHALASTRTVSPTK